MIGRTIIGQYVVRRRLGEGGMGAVYLADQPSVGRQAVVKVMHPNLSSDLEVARRFEVEARAASQLNHPHIITIYNYGAMEDGTLFLAMEYVSGPSLEELVGQGAMSPGRVAAVGAQICDALGEAHRRGVVHRDLKPSNVMLTQVGRQQDFVKVLDFGIAKVEGVKMTRTGSVIGTPQYMSTEQLRGEPLDGRSDLYSLGGILYQMVSGELPFQSETAAGYMHKHLNEPPVSPALRNPEVEVPPGLEVVILRALAKSPGERFPDADAMGRALELCRDGSVVPLTTRSPAASAPQQERRRLGLWVAVAASLVVVAGAAATGVVLYRRGSEPDRKVEAPARQKVAWKNVGGGREAIEDNVKTPRIKETLADAGAPRSAAAVARTPKRIHKRRVAREAGSLSRSAGRARGTDTARKHTVRAEAEPDRPVALAMNRTSEPPVPPTKASRAAAADRYAKMSPVTLEQELKRVVGTAKVPPSMVDKIFESYTAAVASYPPDRREELSRSHLISLLVAYRRPSLQLKPFERRPLPQLRQIFLTMKTKADLSPEQRQRILDQTMAAYDNSNIPVKDRTFYRRMALTAMIERMAVNPREAMR